MTNFIGNDIVCLQTAAQKSNWQRRGFLKKVFTDDEIHLINASSEKNQTVWRLWSMKEAAYKAYVQQTSDTFLNPKKIQCQFNCDKKGSATINSNTYFIETSANSAYIHSIASNSNHLSQDYQIVKFSDQFNTSKSYQIQSSETYQALLKFYAEKTNNSADKLNVCKNKLEIPKLVVNNTIQREAVSISHHGCFGAFVITK